ncbi:MAG: glycerol-3-phosphate dehydrogenase [Aquabacterium sp.]|nr:MAG: glycerol-3-phosphate dehydrogenase [Aquabacterium sp.]
MHIDSAPASIPVDTGHHDCDVLVVGGGINGVGIARDLAGRGWRVVLAERDDLASHTSSASTKLIHGGLRYLEHRQFGLVRKALQERELLLRSAPHIMRSMRFVMPHDPGMRPAWLIRLGLFLYDHLARREWLQGSSGIRLDGTPLGAPLQERFERGFVYSDGWVDDARLVVLAAVDAAERGAVIHTRTPCIRVQRARLGWHALLQHGNGDTQAVHARALVNAAGPWAEEFLRDVARSPDGQALPARGLRIVRGSHIVVPRCFDHDHAYIFQAPDRRIVFAIPYEEHFTLIGTTDVETATPARRCEPDADEIRYLCEQASRCLRQPVLPRQVIWSFAGMRPLLADEAGAASEITRDYLLEADDAAGAPLLSVWGGKITTFRKLAEEAADRVGHMLGEARPAWTAGAGLPGSDLSPWIGRASTPQLDIRRFIAELRRAHPWLEPRLATRLARAYGSRVHGILGAARQASDLGRQVAPSLYEAELHHLCTSEWARTAEDVLWRRSKLGLHLDINQRQAVERWMLRRQEVA